jgi:hypothetical protein
LFSWRRQHDHPTALLLGEEAIVEIVAIQSDQGSAQFAGKSEVLAVSLTAKIVMFDHEQHIPVKVGAHEGHESGRNIGIHIHAGLTSNTPGVRAQFGGERAH